MEQNPETLIKIIEFYLKNMSLINSQLQYRKQKLNTNDPITINKMYNPIPFYELDSIAQVINRAVSNYCGEKAEYITLRYRKKCTYDVICGLMNKKRSTIFALGNEILNELLFAVMLDDKSRTYILKADKRNYFLS